MKKILSSQQIRQVDAYTIQPGQTVETPIAASGVYIVRDTYGRHLRKLLVK